MKHTCVDADDCALRKVNAGYGFSTDRDMAFEDQTNRGVNAEGLVDDCGALWF